MNYWYIQQHEWTSNTYDNYPDWKKPDKSEFTLYDLFLKNCRKYKLITSERKQTCGCLGMAEGKEEQEGSIAKGLEDTGW